ncbi:glycosyl hydrolase 53 family protein [Paenibacillus harenae]|uniref:Arabinogalactan endo-beta-1,4-galactanase n=1 Tax=Paenibacillus harenae TaxID=306543 RepID=A0ABT9UA19_PAEHA|nr:glycosyl hydrolase 53 family protein [Paenibacillus harenae]MDQ0115274.1 arabinogalactan endo-1,4-beta-galactosidase [Paenibacillus harenae]
MKAIWRKRLVLAIIFVLTLTTIAGVGPGIRVSALGGGNLVQNPGFESGDLASWEVTGSTGAVTVKNSTADAHSGSKSISYWLGSDYSFKLSQTITVVEDGMYELRAWVSGGTDKPITISLFAEDFGSEALNLTAVNTGYGSWVQYKLGNIQVTNGQVTVGVDVTAANGAWGYFDDFELVRTDVEPEPPVDPDDFIKGVDISTLQALEDKNIKFYENGTETDLLDILKNHGVNYVRLRLWNNPVEADGYNDKAHLIEMAQRVKAAGLKLLVDFHYSDFWADPGKQVKPEEWKNKTFVELQTAVYDYTEEVLNELAAVHAYPDMVQVGNEINSGMLLPDGAIGEYEQLAQLLKAGIQGVRDTTPGGHETKIMLHLAEGGNNGAFRHFFDKAEENELDYDIIGMSYYPYWHGTFQQLKSNMNDMAARYGKQIVVAETAYPFTLDNADELGNIASKAQTDIAGFEASVANQKLVTEMVLNTVANVDGGMGLGAFYWEPAWLAGVGWTSGEGNGWENQAMFDFDGHALDSLDAFLYTPGSMGEAAPVLVYPSMGMTTTKGLRLELPATANVLYNEGTIQETAVVWDEVANSKWNTPGKFTINGTVVGLEQRASIEITVLTYANNVKNGGFETGDLSDWTITGTSEAGKIEENAGNSHSGSHAFNYWYGTDYAYKLSQTVSGLQDGTYTLKAWASGGAGETKFRLFAQRDEEQGPLAVDIVNEGYNVWKPYAIEGIVVKNGKLTIGFDVEAPPATWGYLDDIELIMTAKAPSNAGNGSSGADVDSDIPAIKISRDKLQKDEQGDFLVQLPANITSVEIPSSLYSELEQGKLKLTNGTMAIEIPAALLAELRNKLGADAAAGTESSITITLQPIDSSKLNGLLWQSNTTIPNTEVKLQGGAYDFKLSIRSEAGEEATLTQFSQPIVLRFAAASPALYTGIYYVGDDGKLTYVDGIWANGEWTAEIEHFSTYALLEVVRRFTDVPAKHWAYDSITELASKDIVQGVTPTTFEPGRAITRAEFTSMLVGALKPSGSGAAHSFGDVPASAWYAPSVNAAFEAGIVAGRSVATFDPSAIISREEMAVMLMKAYELQEGKSATSDTVLPFADLEQISGWALNAVWSAYGLELLKGRSDTRFDAQASLTRAESAAAVSRVLGK